MQQLTGRQKERRRGKAGKPRRRYSPRRLNGLTWAAGGCTPRAVATLHCNRLRHCVSDGLLRDSVADRLAHGRRSGVGYSKDLWVGSVWHGAGATRPRVAQLVRRIGLAVDLGGEDEAVKGTAARAGIGYWRHVAQGKQKHVTGQAHADDACRRLCGQHAHSATGPAIRATSIHRPAAAE